jgi:hypothetical protein
MARLMGGNRHSRERQRQRNAEQEPTKPVLVQKTSHRRFHVASFRLPVDDERASSRMIRSMQHL